MIRLSKSSIGSLEKTAVARVLDGEYLGMGSEVQDFEKKLTLFFGRTAICVSSGTAALHLALQAVGVKSKDEVLVQSLTYVASFQAISACGAKPIACEINPDTLCIDLKDAERRLTKNTKVIMPVHYSGGVGDLEKVYAFAKKHSLRVVEDAAHAFGSKYMGERVGGFGDIACFSFDGVKNITSGEGGCLVTNDRYVLQKVRDARLLGVEKDTEKRYLSERSWDFEVSEQGWRYHMSNIMAAIGIVQLGRINDFRVKRQEIAERYVKELQGIKYIDFLNLNLIEVLPYIFVIKTKKRNALREYLISKNIECGVHYKPNHLLKKYNSKCLPITENVYANILTLPCHYSLTDLEQTQIIKEIRFFFNSKQNLML
jgi:dTDP-4-amino-4,6-dideoxygalactose transaminase